MISERDKFLLGVGLNWGEGTKFGVGGVSLVNSDPDLVLNMKHWFLNLSVLAVQISEPYIFISEIHIRRKK